jgi:hypothetical protein
VVVDNVNSLVLVAGSAAGSISGQAYAGGGADIVLLEYSLDGVLAATEMTGTSATDSGYGVALSSAGSAFIAGYTAGALNGNVNAGGNDICLVQYISGSAGGVPSVVPSLMPAVSTQNSTRPTTNPSRKTSSTPLPSKSPTVVPSVVPSLLNSYFAYDTLGWTEQSGSSARLLLSLTNNLNPFIYIWCFSDVAYGSAVNEGSGDIFVAGSTGGSLNGQSFAGKNYVNHSDILLSLLLFCRRIYRHCLVAVQCR